MTGCERFEIFIEMRRRSALAAADSAVLETHLLTCASCSQFAAFARGSEEQMAETMNTLDAQVDWPKFERKMKRRLRMIRFETVASMAGLGAGTLIALANGRLTNIIFIGVVLSWLLFTLRFNF